MVKKAEKGKLRIRPMERPVYDPSGKGDYVPPKRVELGEAKQKSLFEKKDEYNVKGDLE